MDKKRLLECFLESYRTLCDMPHSVSVRCPHLVDAVPMYASCLPIFKVVFNPHNHVVILTNLKIKHILFATYQYVFVF